MLKIIDFKPTTNSCVIIYEWSVLSEPPTTGAEVLANKQKAYKYWQSVCRSYILKNVDEINKIYDRLQQTTPLDNVWKLTDHKFSQLDFLNLKIKTGDLTILDNFKQLIKNCNSALIEFTKIKTHETK